MVQENLYDYINIAGKEHLPNNRTRFQFHAMYKEHKAIETLH